MTGSTGSGPEPPGGAAPHLLVDQIDRLALTDDAQHHLRVRRLRDGDRLTVTDGAGRWRPCRLVAGEVDADGDVVETVRPEPPITVAFALAKGDKPELVVQKLTELGVDRIVAFRADRSVVRWDDQRAATHVERWRRVSRAAVEQSRRCWLPEIAPVTDVDELVRLGAARVDRGGSPPSLSRSVVAVGPEGGWSEDERERLEHAVALGPHVLRAETAALTAGGVLCSIRSGLVREVGSQGSEVGKPG